MEMNQKQEIMRRDITYIQGVQMEEAAEILRHSFFRDEQMELTEREIRNEAELKQVFQDWLEYWRFERCLSEFHAFTGRDMFYYYGKCAVCNSSQPFIADYQFAGEENGVPRINWRERLVCPNCGCNNRQRFMLQKVFERYEPGMQVLLYEQSTEAFKRIQREIPDVAGFEPVRGDRGSEEGIQYQDICRLEYPDEEFELLVSNDVFSETGEYEKAFREAARVLKPGGRMIFTVPFDGNSQTSEDRGNVVVFGWDLRETMKKCGFRDVCCRVYYGLREGYLGYLPMYFEALK